MVPAQGTNYREKIGSQIFFVGIGVSKEISHLVKWKHLQNGRHFVADFMNILKELQPYSSIYTSFQYKNSMGNKLKNKI